MARKRGGGFKAPGNYEPKRTGKGGGKGGRPQGAEARPGRDGVTAKRGGATGAQAAARGGNDKSAGAGREKGAGSQAAGAPTPRELLPPLQTLPAPLDAVRTRPEDVRAESFAELGLGGNIVRALGELGATKPFPIQAVTIPDALAGHHVLGKGRTGSGKTIAFGAAVVERLMMLKAAGAFPDDTPREKPKRGALQKRPTRAEARPAKALILAPTRELALQIDRTVQPIARAVGLYTGQFVGGQPFEPQLHALARGVDIVVGTPGRIEDLEKRGHLRLGQVAITVIDEADHMAELGFIEPVRRLMKMTRRGGQRLLFSATLDRGVDELVSAFMPKPAIHEIVGDSSVDGKDDIGGLAQANVEHRVLIVLREHKDEVLVQLAAGGGRTLVFCRTRAYADRVVELLQEAGISARPLHGDLSQARRERNLDSFASGKVDVLVATDVAARGIHVDDIDLVLQADPPDDPKTYVHRAGRTGRVGKAGTALTLIPRTRQKRTRELFEALGFELASFGDFAPGDKLSPAG